MITEKIGLRIKQLRNEKGISQEQLALNCDIDRTYMSGVESGKRNITVKNLEKILNTLNISFSEFFDSDLFR